MTEFLTSQTGAVAAIGAVLAIAVAISALVRPWLQSRRDRRSSRADVRVTAPLLSELSRSSNAYELRFEIANSGGRPAVAIAVRLRVLSQEPSTTVVATVHQAPLTVNQHRVKFEPDREQYDVRARTFGPDLPPLSLAEAEVEAFLVKLVADQPFRYTAQVEVDWYDVKEPDRARVAASTPFEVDFPPRESIGAPPIN